MFKVYHCDAADEDDEWVNDECECEDKSGCGWREFDDVNAALKAGWWFECHECEFKIRDDDNECDVEDCSHPRHRVDSAGPVGGGPAMISFAYHELEPCASSNGAHIWCSPECRDKWRKARARRDARMAAVVEVVATAIPGARVRTTTWGWGWTSPDGHLPIALRGAEDAWIEFALPNEPSMSIRWRLGAARLTMMRAQNLTHVDAMAAWAPWRGKLLDECRSRGIGVDATEDEGENVQTD